MGLETRDGADSNLEQKKPANSENLLAKPIETKEALSILKDGDAAKQLPAEMPKLELFESAAVPANNGRIAAPGDSVPPGKNVLAALPRPAGEIESGKAGDKPADDFVPGRPTKSDLARPTGFSVSSDKELKALGFPEVSIDTDADAAISGVVESAEVRERSLSERAQKLLERMPGIAGEIPAEKQDDFARSVVTAADIISGTESSALPEVFPVIIKNAQENLEDPTSNVFARALGDTLRTMPDNSLTTEYFGGETLLRDSKGVTDASPNGIVGREFIGNLANHLVYDRMSFDAATAVVKIEDSALSSLPLDQQDEFLNSTVLEDFTKEGMFLPLHSAEARTKTEKSPDLNSQQLLLEKQLGESEKGINDPHAVRDIVAVADAVAFAHPGRQADILAKSFKQLSENYPKEDPVVLSDMLARSMNNATQTNDFSISHNSEASEERKESSLTFFSDKRLESLNGAGRFGAVVSHSENVDIESQALQAAVTIAAVIREGGSQIGPNEPIGKFSNQVFGMRDFRPD